MFGGRLALRNTTALIGLLALIVGVAQWHGSPVAYAAATISGTVFQDYNGNGTQDLNATINNLGGGTVRTAFDQGLGGVVITAYNGAGAVVGTTTAAADGSYTLNATGSAPYRVEFSNLPTGFQPGPVGSNNGTTVRFIDNDGVNSDVDLGIILPGEYCQDNPDLITSCFRSGPQLGVTESSVQSFPYNAGSTIASTTLPPYRLPLSHNLSVDSANTGAVWGLEHSRTRDVVYAAAFFKKHAGFGPGADGTFGTTANPGDDPGAIYLISEASGLISDVFTIPGAVTNAHDTSDYVIDGYNTAWNAVGKTSLGGIAISDDETTLFVMSLEDRILYALNASTGAVVAQTPVPGVGASTVAAPPLPPPAVGAPPLPATCPDVAIRPFAVQFERGELYVGITCTGEGSTTVDTYTEASVPPNGRFDHSNATERNSVVDNDGNGVYNEGDARQLQAYVYRVNPQTLAFEAAPYFQAALNYPRGIANANGQPPAEWRPWITGFDYITIGERTVYYPQPWLTDLTFDGPNLLLVFRDRTGDTTGYQAPSNPPPALPTELWDGVGVGDVLRACPNGAGQLTLENNGSCGGVTVTPTAGGPALTPQGPGGGEYYFDDGYGITGGSTVNHDEVSIGGSVRVPGRPDSVVTTFDAFPLRGGGINEVFNGGFRWYSNSGANAGLFQKAYVLFETPNNVDPLTFGKANGLGDLIVLCDLAPIEIGNRVWRDDDLDGTQDPNEPVIPNVTLQLFQGSTLIDTAVTDANGNYIFSAYRTAGATTSAFRYGLNLRPNTQYTVRISNVTGASQQAALVGLVPTLANAGGISNDVRDSDGVYTQALNLVQTTLTTGGVGANNHTYDFGFVARTTAIVLESFGARLVSGGAVVEWTTSIELDTWGFHLYRSKTGQLADAVRVTDQLILARGNSSRGATYSFVDTTATDGPYTYWLEEHTRDGERIVYGPEGTTLAADGTIQAWLPFVTR